MLREVKRLTQGYTAVGSTLQKRDQILNMLKALLVVTFPIHSLIPVSFLLVHSPMGTLCSSGTSFFSSRSQLQCHLVQEALLDYP